MLGSCLEDSSHRPAVPLEASAEHNETSAFAASLLSPPDAAADANDATDQSSNCLSGYESFHGLQAANDSATSMYKEVEAHGDEYPFLMQRQAPLPSGKVCDLIVDMKAANAAVSAALTGIPGGRHNSGEVVAMQAQRHGGLAPPVLSARRTVSQPQSHLFGISSLLQLNPQSPVQQYQPDNMWAHSQPHPQFSLHHPVDMRRQYSTAGARMPSGVFPSVAEDAAEVAFIQPTFYRHHGSTTTPTNELHAGIAAYQDAAMRHLSLGGMGGGPFADTSPVQPYSPIPPYLPQQALHHSHYHNFVNYPGAQQPGLQPPHSRPFSGPQLQQQPQQQYSMPSGRVVGLSQSLSSSRSPSVMGMGACNTPAQSVLAGMAACNTPVQSVLAAMQQQQQALAASGGAKPQPSMSPLVMSPAEPVLQGVLGLGATPMAATTQPFPAPASGTAALRTQVPAQMQPLRNGHGLAASPNTKGMQPAKSAAQPHQVLKHGWPLQSSSPSSSPEVVAAAVQQQLHMMAAANTVKKKQHQLLDYAAAAAWHREGRSAGGAIGSAFLLKQPGRKSPAGVSSCPNTVTGTRQPDSLADRLLPRYQEALAATRAAGAQHPDRQSGVSSQRAQREQELLKAIADALGAPFTDEDVGGDKGCDAFDALLVSAQRQIAEFGSGGLSELHKSGLLLLARAAALLLGPAGSGNAPRQARYAAASRLLHTLAATGAAADEVYLSELQKLLPTNPQQPGSSAAEAIDESSASAVAASPTSAQTPAAMAAALTQLRAEVSRAAEREREVAARQLLEAIKCPADTTAANSTAASSSVATGGGGDDASSTCGSVSGSSSGSGGEGAVSSSGGGSAAGGCGLVVKGKSSSSRHSLEAKKPAEEAAPVQGLAATLPSAEQPAFLGRSFSLPGGRNNNEKQPWKQRSPQKPPSNSSNSNPFSPNTCSSGSGMQQQFVDGDLNGGISAIGSFLDSAGISVTSLGLHDPSQVELEAAALAQLLQSEDADILGAAAATAAMGSGFGARASVLTTAGSEEDAGLGSDSALASLLESFSQLSPLMNGGASLPDDALSTATSFGASLASPPMAPPMNPLALNGVSVGAQGPGGAFAAATAAQKRGSFAASNSGLVSNGRRHQQLNQPQTHPMQLLEQQQGPSVPAAAVGAAGAGLARGAPGMQPSTFLLQQEQKQMQQQMQRLQLGANFGGSSALFGAASSGSGPLPLDAFCGGGNLDPLDSLRWDPATLQAALQLLQATGQQLDG